MRSPVYSTIFFPRGIGSRVKHPAAWMPEERTMRRIGRLLLLAAMRENVPFQCGRGAMEPPVDKGKRVGPPAITGAPVIALSGAGASPLRPGFLVEFLQAGAHSRQVFTPHGRSIA